MKLHLMHKYEVIKDTGKYSYQQCECGKKRVKENFYGGLQPIDKEWLKTK